MDALTQLLVPIAGDPARLAEAGGELSEFCHAVRNRLHGLRLGLYLVRRQAGAGREGTWEAVERHYSNLEQFMERLQSLRRPLDLTPLPVSLQELLEPRRVVWAEWLAQRESDLEWVAPPGPIQGTFDAVQLGHALDDFVAWRAEVASPHSVACLTWRRVDDDAILSWQEDGPHPDGGSEDLTTPPSRLALALLTRVLVAHGGRLDILEADRFGVEIRLPLAEPERNE